MATRAREIEQAFLANIQSETSKNLDDWMTYLAATELSKTKALIAHLKAEFPLNHRQASMLAGIYLNDGQPVYDYDVLFKKLFDGKAAMQALYEDVAQIVAEKLPDTVELIPTKTYVSIEAERVFACAKINKTNLRVGVDLDREFDDYVVVAKGLGAMPNISHMVEIKSVDDIDDRLADVLLEAYHNRH